MKSILDHQLLEIEINRKTTEVAEKIVFDFTSQTPPDLDQSIPQSSVNYIDNSDMDFSKDAYVNSTPVGGDAAEECYNFYRQRFIRITDGLLIAADTNLNSASAPFKSTYTYPMLFFALAAGTDEKALVGTITRVDDENATMSVASVASITNAIVFFGDAYAATSANAVKATAHSLFAANEGTNDSITRWDKVAGQIEIGGDSEDIFDVASPLPFNLATRGTDFFFSANVKIRSGADCPNPVVLYVGVYDTTSGNEKFLEADNFDLTVVYVGTAGTNEYDLIVVGRYSNGQQVASDVVNITGVGDLDADNYLDWDWQNAPNILDFSLYRSNVHTGEIVRVFTIYNGETRFFDHSPSGEETVLSFPTAPARREYSYAESPPFVPTTEFRRVAIFFRVPPTYGQAATTARQILRIGIYNDAGNNTRPMILDRIMFCLQPESVWNRSSRDLERIQTTTPTATIPDGHHPTFCFAGNTPIWVKKRLIDDWKRIPISQAEKGQYIYDGLTYDRILKVKESETTKLFRVALSNGIWFECTDTERFITGPADRNGTPLNRLNRGDFIQTVIDGTNYQAKIKEIRQIDYSEPQKIFTLSLERAKIFVAGHYRSFNPITVIRQWFKPIIAGAKAHNRKVDDI